MTENSKKSVKLGAVAGIVLGILCHFAPTQYQTACEAVSNALTFSGC